MTRKTLDMCRRSGDGFFFLMTLGTFSPALEIFEVRRPELHLCEFYRVLVALPVEPVDPLQGGGGGKKKKGWKSRREAHGTYCTIHQRKHSFHNTQPREIAFQNISVERFKGEKQKKRKGQEALEERRKE